MASLFVFNCQSNCSHDSKPVFQQEKSPIEGKIGDRGMVKQMAEMRSWLLTVNFEKTQLYHCMVSLTFDIQLSSIQGNLKCNLGTHGTKLWAFREDRWVKKKQT